LSSELDTLVIAEPETDHDELFSTALAETPHESTSKVPFCCSL
jgi:hypothetical protein